jgi:hypothetical protein
MAFEHTPVILTEAPSFEAILDNAFERLTEKHIQYSIRRIKELELELERLEKELEEFLGSCHD